MQRFTRFPRSPGRISGFSYLLHAEKNPPATVNKKKKTMFKKVVTHVLLPFKERIQASCPPLLPYLADELDPLHLVRCLLEARDPRRLLLAVLSLQQQIEDAIVEQPNADAVRDASLWMQINSRILKDDGHGIDGDLKFRRGIR